MKQIQTNVNWCSQVEVHIAEAQWKEGHGFGVVFIIDDKEIWVTEWSELSENESSILENVANAFIYKAETDAQT